MLHRPAGGDSPACAANKTQQNSVSGDEDGERAGCPSPAGSMPSHARQGIGKGRQLPQARSWSDAGVQAGTDKMESPKMRIKRPTLMDEKEHRKPCFRDRLDRYRDWATG